MNTITPDITFDISSISNMFNFNKTQIKDFVNNVLVDISDAVIYQWREEAHNSLGSTRNQYIRGIQEPKISNNRSVIILIGGLPNMIESGAPAFDLKQGFRKSLKKKIKVGGGWYLTIPFRWSSSDALGENEAFSNKMPVEVYKEASSLKASLLTGENKVKYSKGLNVKNLSNNFQSIKTRAEIKDSEGNIVYGAYKHKSSIYQGITKFQNTYEKATQNTYFSFRRVSDNSDPLSWIHPGFVAKNLAEKAISKLDIDNVINNSANIFVESLGY